MGSAKIIGLEQFLKKAEEEEEEVTIAEQVLEEKKVDAARLRIKMKEAVKKIEDELKKVAKSMEDRELQHYHEHRKSKPRDEVHAR